jgi:hypothetical protein
MTISPSVNAATIGVPPAEVFDVLENLAEPSWRVSVVECAASSDSGSAG